MRCTLTAAAAAGVLCAVAVAGAGTTRVSGRVLQVTVRETFISLGAKHGLRPGDQVEVPLVDLTTDRVKVLDVYASGARVAVSPDRAVPLHKGQVWAEVAGPRPPSPRPRTRTLPPLATPGELAAHWEGVALERPAKADVGRRGAGERGGSELGVHGALRLEYLGSYELGDLRTHSHRVGLLSELGVAGRWLDYAHRVRLRLDVAPGQTRPYPDSRPNVLVHSLRGGVHVGRLDGELGRMSGAPLPVSSLVDGASLRVRITPGLHLGVFGGLAPRAADLRPATDSGLFGVYSSLRLASRAAGAWHVEADAGVVGSTWQGELDRKTLVLQVAVGGARSWIHALAVADLYTGQDPGGRPVVDLSVGAVEVGAELVRGLRADVRFDFYRPVISREALSFLPASALAEDAVAALRGSLGYRLGARVGLDAEVIWEHHAASQLVWGGAGVHATSLLRADDLGWLTLSAAVSSLQDDYGARVGYALPLVAWLGASASYAAHYFRGASGGSGVRHGPTLGLDLTFTRWIAALDAAALIGPDERSLLTFGTLGYRF